TQPCPDVVLPRRPPSARDRHRRPSETGHTRDRPEPQRNNRTSRSVHIGCPGVRHPVPITVIHRAAHRGRDPVRPGRGPPTRLHPHLRQHLYTALHLLATRGHDAVLTALCHLADYLDEHGSPIDYRRRSIITPAILTEPDWLTICRHASAHPGLRGSRFR